MHAFDNACARAIIEMPKALLKMEQMFGGPSEPCSDDDASEYVVTDSSSDSGGGGSGCGSGLSSGSFLQ